jgi:hypothetical protein
MSDDIARLLGLDVTAIASLYDEKTFALSLPVVTKADLTALRGPLPKKSRVTDTITSATGTATTATAGASIVTDGNVIAEAVENNNEMPLIDTTPVVERPKKKQRRRKKATDCVERESRGGEPNK